MKMMNGFGFLYYFTLSLTSLVVWWFLETCFYPFFVWTLDGSLSNASRQTWWESCKSLLFRFVKTEVVG